MLTLVSAKASSLTDRSLSPHPRTSAASLAPSLPMLVELRPEFYTIISMISQLHIACDSC
jgi:hypothetical protein